MADVYNIEAAIQHERYLTKARAVGISPEVAEAELNAVRREIYHPARCTAGAEQEYEIAWRRLIDGGPKYRPADEVRTALRSGFPNAHPEWIDQVARQAAPGATLAEEWERSPH